MNIRNIEYSNVQPFTTALLGVCAEGKSSHALCTQLGSAEYTQTSHSVTLGTHLKSICERDLMRIFRVSSFLFVFAVSCFLLIWHGLALAQSSGAPASYDPRLTFAPLTLPDPVNAYRSGNGSPGPSYWQNEANYELHAELDTTAKQLKGDESIAYTNNSPDVLASLWVQLDQNMYRADSRAKRMGGGGRWRRNSDLQKFESASTEGFVLDAVQIETGKQTTKTDYIVSDTRMQIRLPEPLNGHGGKLKIHNPLSLPNSRRVGRPYVMGQVGERRNLRHGAVVSAHVCL
jgi:hypothetical protein